MREIKFRAWDLKNKKIIPAVMSCIYRNRHSLHGDIYFYQAEPFGEAVRIELMQYTGLKDKNGVEIYEGDILQPSNNEKKFYSVVFRNGCFERKYKFIRKYQGDQWEEISYLPVHADSFKVVGNIYENSELIERD